MNISKSLNNCNKITPTAPKVTIIVGERWPMINWQELVQYRDLFLFLVWRDIKTRYAQSMLGIGWAIIQPVFAMIVFTIVFGMPGSGTAA